jgi:hypothetical protein
MEEVAIVSDGPGKAGFACAQAIVILFTISVWKKLFIQQPNGIDNRPLDRKAEAIDQRHPGILRSVKNGENR